jgi:hypothetical protein
MESIVRRESVMLFSRVARTWGAVAVLLVCGLSVDGADYLGLTPGTPALKSAGPLAFGPYGVLLVGDTKAAAIFAIDTGDVKGDPASVQWSIEGMEAKLAEVLSASADDIQIHDLAVNPLSGNAYLSVSVNGSDHLPALIRVDRSGDISQLSLEGVRFSKATLPNPPEDKVVGEGRRRGNRRDESITDLAFVNGQVIVAGLTSDPSPSNVRALPFPFRETSEGTRLEIFHGAHGRLEDYAPARTLVPFTIGGEPSLLAGFTCTPLVKISLPDLAPGTKVRGTTVAELGNRNRPLDMIAYKKGDKDFLLLANSSRGVMKISTEAIERQEGIDEKVPDGGTAGQSYETIDELAGVVQLDRLNDEQAVVLVQADSGAIALRTVALP